VNAVSINRAELEASRPTLGPDRRANLGDTEKPEGVDRVTTVEMSIMSPELPDLGLPGMTWRSPISLTLRIFSVLYFSSER
jgi:hypothetical protein